MIDFGSDRVSVVRITRNLRNSGTNKICQINSNQISDLWRDPLLKTSDALASLFHNTAAVVEGDSDARFLRAVIDALDVPGSAARDIRFFHCGGKDRVHRIVEAFRAIGIVAIAIVDIDILSDKAKFFQLVESFGGNRSDFEVDLSIILKHIGSKRVLESTGNAKSRIDEIFSPLNHKRPLPNNVINACYDVLKSSSAWSPLKIAGIEALDAGEPSHVIERIISKAKDIGLIINQYGELESLWKFASGSKSEWLAAALDNDLRNEPKMEKARNFARSILSTNELMLAK